MNYKKSVRVAIAMKGETLKHFANHCDISLVALHKRFHRSEPYLSWIQQVADYAGEDLHVVIKWGE